MSKIKQSLLFAVSLILVLTATAICAGAQTRDPNNPPPSPTPKPPPRGVVSRSSNGTRLIDRPGIYGTIRWRKEMGLPYQNSSGRPESSICGVFGVRLTVQQPTLPGTFGRTDTLDSFQLKGSPTHDGDYYVCSFEMPDHPYPRTQVVGWTSQKLVISAEFWKSTANETRPWKVGSNAQPPPGQQRAIIIIGGRNNNGITLTDAQPHATADFEMVYRSVSSPPR